MCPGAVITKFGLELQRRFLLLIALLDLSQKPRLLLCQGLLLLLHQVAILLQLLLSYNYYRVT